MQLRSKLLTLNSVPRLLLAAALFCAALPAHATEQVLRYSLEIGGQPAGKREVRIRYLPPEPGVSDSEIRVISAYTELDSTGGPVQIHLRSRVSARATDSRMSFSASVQDGGKSREVQARQGSDQRWTVTILENGERNTWSLRRSEVQLSTMDLHDPLLHERLFDAPTAQILIAETGQVLSGAVEDLGESTIKVAGKDVPVRRAVWRTDGTELTFSWSLSGLLLSYDMRVMGRSVSATVDALPENREWGQIDSSAQHFGNDNTVQEEEL